MLTCASLVAVICLLPRDKGAYTYKLNTFQSYDELFAFLQKRYESGSGQERYYDSPNVLFDKSTGAADATAQGSGETLPSYSTTNVQVVGVDEPDIVKTDGAYLYVVANQIVYIIKAYPVAEATILSEITITNVSISNIFIRSDRLFFIGDYGGFYPYPLLEGGVKEDMIRPGYMVWWSHKQSSMSTISMTEQTRCL